eukprot:TRINITY_DN499_c0_g1_i5.p1 TRINITY_DN499_c0_g1~~TRINITY_DN499_c0_g1_i5.p1  ORF type:complete len:659 (+),score=156.66 TRINITY_DN499_c0_g1_i5:1203-3179(+)
MSNYAPAVIAVCFALESCFRGFSNVWTDRVAGHIAFAGIVSALAVLTGVGTLCDALGGGNEWLLKVIPIAALLAVREGALVMLGSCCSPAVAALYSSASLLVLTVPFLYVMRGKSSSSSFFALVASVLLFLIEYDAEQACGAMCLLYVFVVSACLSAAVVLLFVHGEETDGGSMAPALMIVSLLSLAYLVSGPVPLIPSILQSVNRVMLLTAIVKASRLSSPLTDVYFAAIGGSCIPEVFGGSVGKLVAVVLCGAICVVHLALRPKTESPKRGVSNGKLLSLLALVALAFIAFYPAGHAPSGTLPATRVQEVTRAPAGVESIIVNNTRRYVRDDRLVNGVIIYLDSKRKPIEKALVLVQKHFLSCWPYPVHVFKEGVTEQYVQQVRSVTTSQVNFTEIGHFFDIPPNNISMGTLNFWIDVMKYGRGHHFGYRMMCRFFSGIFAQYTFLKQYDYYWRLDTDSWIREPVLVDPFRHMVATGCRYGHMSSHHSDKETVTRNLYPTVLEWAEEYNVAEENITRLNRRVTSNTGEYKRAMYYNNFEIASVPWITGDAYKSFFNYLDYTDGFMKYRWGDAPVRTLAVHLMLDDTEICDFENYLPYKHGAFNNTKYRKAALVRPTCPSIYMAKSGSHYLHPPQYITAPYLSSPPASTHNTTGPLC